MDNRKPTGVAASELANNVGVKKALFLVGEAINRKQKEKPSALSTYIWVEEIEYLKDVKAELQKL